MKIRFTKQKYQHDAVAAVVDCFHGQPQATGQRYTMDPGRMDGAVDDPGDMALEFSGVANAPLVLQDAALLENIRQIQRVRNLPVSTKLVATPSARLNLDVEMETGTGKTYVYIRTIFELNQRYGWSKFIVVVPSIAIREGTRRAFEMTAAHFQEDYGKQARFFVYDSRQLHKIEGFSSGAGVNVMIINVQAFVATGKDARRIHMELDDFQSRRPIDVLRANRPILILDEPQKLEGKQTTQALGAFSPLFVLRYSATHRRQHNRVYRLDALDAYNQKLVKKIRVVGIARKGLTGVDGYLFLEGIVLGGGRPRARIELEQRLPKGGVRRVTRLLGVGAKLFDESGGLPAYEGYVISSVDAAHDSITFTNGKEMLAGMVTGDVNEAVLRRIQIRETIRAHLAAEQALYPRGIKVLSLFFIDEVAKYRVYDDEDGGGGPGEYARVFEEEYERLLLETMDPIESPWQRYVKEIPASATHNGYFARDRKGRMSDPSVMKRGDDAGLTDDIDAYDLILRDKESLLSFPSASDDGEARRRKQVRFIFSHSALREGWDSPNVFNICTLKHSDNITTRRQEVGRGMRLCVDQGGCRWDDPATTHDVNVLTVVANESYEDFVKALQSEISESLTERPKFADVNYFKGKTLVDAADGGTVVVDQELANSIDFYLVTRGYTDSRKNVTAAYHEARREGTLAALPEELAPFGESVFKLVDSVFSDAALPDISDGRAAKVNPLNEANFMKKEFQELWGHINRKASYTVAFDSEELIKKAIHALDHKLRVSKVEFTIVTGSQKDELDFEDAKQGEGFTLMEQERSLHAAAVSKGVAYDLVGEVADRANLLRRTAARILAGITPAAFSLYKDNPEAFIAQASLLIKEQMATMVIQRLSYSPLEERHSTDIFTAAQVMNATPGREMKKHIYKYVITDSEVERKFAVDLDTHAEVVVYAKLPRGFAIPTPVGDYNPDWAVAFETGKVKHVYFIAETKGSLSTMELRKIEEAKIECARKFFAKITSDQVRYDVIDGYERLMELVR